VFTPGDNTLVNTGKVLTLTFHLHQTKSQLLVVQVANCSFEDHTMHLPNAVYLLKKLLFESVGRQQS